MIKEVKFLVGSQVIQKFTGDYLHALVERDFDESKKDLYYKMSGNVAELNDPANAFDRNNFYPSAWPTNSPNYKSVGPARRGGNKLYFKNILFTSVFMGPMCPWGQIYGYLTEYKTFVKLN